MMAAIKENLAWPTYDLFSRFLQLRFWYNWNKMEVVVRKGEKHDNHTWHTSCIFFLKNMIAKCKSNAVTYNFVLFVKNMLTWTAPIPESLFTPSISVMLNDLGFKPWSDCINTKPCRVIQSFLCLNVSTFEIFF